MAQIFSYSSFSPIMIGFEDLLCIVVALLAAGDTMTTLRTSISVSFIFISLVLRFLDSVQLPDLYTVTSKSAR